jgi:hypothetical protein
MPGIAPIKKNLNGLALGLIVIIRSWWDSLYMDYSLYNQVELQ